MDETTGDMKSTFQIFQDLKTDWDNMTNAEKQAIAITNAGKNQFEVFSAVMNNFETAVNATNTALNSMGSAEQENAKYMESVEAKIQALKGEFQDFANNVISSNEVKNVLSTVIDLLGKLNTEVGQTITKLVLFGAILGGGTIIWGTALRNIVDSFKMLTSTGVIGKVIEAFKLVKGGAGTAAEAIGAVGLKTNLVFLGITAAIAGVSALWKWYGDLTNAAEVHREKASELKEEYDATFGKNSRYDELLSKQGQLTEKEQQELTILQAQNEELKKKIQLEEEASFKAFRADEEGNTVMGSFAGYEDVNPLSDYQPSDNFIDKLKADYEELETIQTDTIIGMQNYLDKSNEIIASNADRYNQLKHYQEAGFVLNEQELSFLKNYEQLLKDNKTTTDEYNQAKSDTTRITREMFEANTALVNQIEENLTPQMEKYPELASEISEQSHAIIDAQKELNEKGELSAETYDRLNNLGEDFISMLLDENGMLDLNSIRVQEVLNQLLGYSNELGTNTIPQTETTTGIFNTLGGVLDNVYGAGLNASSGVSSAGNAAATSGGQANTAASKWATFLTKLQQVANFLASGVLSGYTDVTIGGNALNLGGQNKSNQSISDRRHSNEQENETIKASLSASNIIIPKSGTNKSTTIDDNGIVAGTGGGGGSSSSGSGGSSGGGSSKSTTDTIKEQYDAEYALLVQQYNRMEISDRDFYTKREDLIDKYLQNHEDYEKEIKSLYDDEKKYYKHLLDMGEIDEEQYLQHQKDLIESLLKGTSYYIDTLYEWQEDWKKYIDKQKDELLKNQKSAMDKIADYYKEYAQRQLDITNTNIEETEKRLDAIDEKYEEKANKRKEEYDDAIKAIDKQNDALERELRLEELLNNLAKAKNTLHRVYRNGKFVYEADADAISDAQRAIDEYNREQEETERKEALKSELEADLEVLEERRKAEREDLELWLNQLKQDKEFWESYKEGWSNLTKDYEYYQNKLLAEQVFGAEQEMMTNEKRLEAYRDFVSQYIHLQEQLEGATQQTLSDSLGGNSSLNIKPISFSKGGKTYDANVDYAQRMLDSKSAAELYTNMQLRNAKIEALGLEDGSYVSNEAIISQWHSKGLANGTLSASGGIHLVGENGAELRVLNNGDGIIPNSITKTLWSFGMNPSGFLGNLADRFGGSIYSFNISTLSLPNATDAQGLVTGLRNAAQQYVYQRA